MKSINNRKIMHAPLPRTFSQCDRGGLLEFLRKQGENPAANRQEKSPIINETVQNITRRMAQNLPDQTPNEWMKGMDGTWIVAKSAND